MFLEKLYGVVAEAGLQRVELAGRGVVRAHLKEASVFIGGKCGAHGKGEQRGEQEGSFHGGEDGARAAW